MASILTLRNTDANGLSTIYCQYTNKGKQRRWNTGIKIPASYWNSSKEMIKAGALDNVEAANDLIRDIQNKVNKIVYDYKREFLSLPSVEHVTREFDKAVEAKQAQEKSLLDYLNEFIELRKDTLAKESLKSYTNLRTNLTEYQTKYKTVLQFEDIDNRFLDRFNSLLVKPGKYTGVRRSGETWVSIVKDREPYLNTTIKKRIASLKEFMGYYSKAGINTNLKFKEFAIKVTGNVNRDVVSLDTKEFKLLLELDLSNNKSLERVRDLFAFSCSTGLRFSDLHSVGRHNVYNGCINIVTKKTKQSLSIPLNKVSRELLEKYDYKFRKISNQNYNKMIKDICRMIPELRKIETVTTFSGNNKSVEQLEKWSLICSHSGRRSFVNMLMEKDKNPAHIMNYTGHRTLEMFMVYINKKSNSVDDMADVFG